MRYPTLTRAQRIAVARVAGSVQRLAYGNDAGLPLDEKLAQLRAITADPTVFGYELGDCLAGLDDAARAVHFQACIDLLRAVGADEGAARHKLAWRLAQREKQADLAPGLHR